MIKHDSLYRMVWVVMLGIILVSCGSTRNFLEPDVPKFTGNFARNLPPSERSIKVVTFNIKAARKVDHAIYELSEFPELREADILLLQEMDSEGTEQIAKALGYNYVYYPAVFHSRFDKYFGNAILSKWPIHEEAKMLLPHENPMDKQRRIAVSATVMIGSDPFKVYSVHTETLWLSRSKRLDQVKTLVDHISDQPMFQYVIVGGDFNTVRKKDIEAITNIFGTARLEQATEGVGATSKIFMALDHIYTKGMHIIDAGKVKKTSASDHYPVWVILAK